MSLKKKIEDKLNEALKAKDKNTYPTLRLIVSAIKDAEIAGRSKGHKEIKDSEITSLLKKTKEENSTIGTKSFCKLYNDKCYYDAYMLFEITDKLDWIFKKDQSYFKFLKKAGFNIINKNRIFKEKIVKFAMGF